MFTRFIERVHSHHLFHEFMKLLLKLLPEQDGALDRVFPSVGKPREWPLSREGGGGVLLYNNFRARIWAPFLKKLGLPAVTPDSARPSFISTLQAQGVEVGPVARLAGHKSAVVTLCLYTHAVRGGEQAVEMLDQAYSDPFDGALKPPRYLK
jgi:integrase